MDYGNLLYEKADGDAFVTITLNRPEQLNALNTPLIEELDDAVRTASKDPAVNALVIKGAGRAFSAGYDLSSAEDAPEATANASRLGSNAEPWRDDMLERCVKKMLAIWSAPIPIIAQVHGYALGGALDLVLCCDLAIAASDAKLGEPEIRHISAPPTFILPWVIPVRHARHLLYTGDMISGTEAERIHLVNRAVDPADLDAEVTRLAKKLARMPVPGIKFNKAAINNVFETAGMHGSLQYAVDMAAILHTDEAGLGWVQMLEEVGVKEFLRRREAPFRELDA